MDEFENLNLSDLAALKNRIEFLKEENNWLKDELNKAKRIIRQNVHPIREADARTHQVLYHNVKPKHYGNW